MLRKALDYVFCALALGTMAYFVWGLGPSPVVKKQSHATVQKKGPLE